MGGELCASYLERTGQWERGCSVGKGREERSEGEGGERDQRGNRSSSKK